MAVGTLVDTNVLLDVMTEDPLWLEWSLDALAAAAEAGPLMINPVIYAETSIRFSSIEDLEAALPPKDFLRRPIPWEAAFLAGKAFAQHRSQGGARTSILPDFLIGAHAAVDRLTLLTRDAARFRTYFPSVRMIAPSS